MKKLRHEAIIKIINENEVDTQEKLQELLCKCGYEVTQATVSRDINELSLVKTLSSRGNYKYTQLSQKRNAVLTPLQQLHKLLADLAISFDYAMNTVVIRCHIGMAQAVCAKLDDAKLPHVVGTIAGDDTIFVLMRTQSDAEHLVNELGADLKK